MQCCRRARGRRRCSIRRWQHCPAGSRERTGRRSTRARRACCSRCPPSRSLSSARLVATHLRSHALWRQVIASESSQKRGAISIGVHHYVRWECEGAYTVWLEMMHRAMRGFDGFLSLRTLKPEDCESLDEQTEEVEYFSLPFTPPPHRPPIPHPSSYRSPTPASHDPYPLPLTTSQPPAPPDSIDCILRCMQSSSDSLPSRRCRHASQSSRVHGCRGGTFEHK